VTAATVLLFPYLRVLKLQNLETQIISVEQNPLEVSSCSADKMFYFHGYRDADSEISYEFRNPLY
jgi:hypothetical protein